MNKVEEAKEAEVVEKKPALEKGMFSSKAGVAVLLVGWAYVSWTIGQYVVVWSLKLAKWMGADVGWVNSPLGTMIITILMYAISLTLIIVVPWRLNKKFKSSREELGLSGLPTWTDVGLAPAGFVAYLVLANIFVGLMSMFAWFDATQKQEVGYDTYLTGPDRIFAFVSLVVVAPIAEELIFRGWLYGKMRARLNVWVSVLIVSVFFGLMHMGMDADGGIVGLNVAVNVFGMSIVMCAIREITGTIWSGIFLHMIKNAIAFYFLFINPIMLQ